MTRTIHIVNPLRQTAGSEWRAVNLCRELSPSAATLLWTADDPHAVFAQDPHLRRLGIDGHPRGGTLIIVGTYFPLGAWLESACPDRVIVIHNTVDYHSLQGTLRRLAAAGLVAEVVYTSHVAALAGGMPGVVEHSHIDCRRFVPPTGKHAPGDGFVVGRLSRDVPEKHHPDDPALYAALLGDGMQVELMGATCLASELPRHPALTLRPTGACPAEQFLRGLDCFVFRTHPSWLEPLGRVVLEAMACALPVVAHRSGGYCEIIEDGTDALLFDTTAGAVAAVRRLRDDPDLCRRLGTAARARVSAACGEASRPVWRDYYLRSGKMPHIQA